MAERLGLAPSTVRAKARSLGGVRTRDGWRFPAEVSMERVRERITVRQKREPAIPQAGEMAAKAFPLFAAATPIEEVVIQLEADPAVVLRLHDLWLQCRQKTEAWIPSAKTPSPRAGAPSTIAPPHINHEPNATFDCCAWHAKQKELKAQE